MKVVELLIVNVTQHTSLVEVMEKGGRGGVLDGCFVFFLFVLFFFAKTNVIRR